MTDTKDSGTCGFCGFGDGYLGEQGDETSQVLHSAVKNEDGTYSNHPNGHGYLQQYILWCGHCISGLVHKYQRYDDTNLNAAYLSAKLRFELDPIRWTFWSMTEDERKAATAAGVTPDDPAIHLEKLQLERDLEDIQNEKFRRAGFDLTTRDWRD